MTCILIVIFGGFLLYRYRGKLTPAEIEIKNRKKQEYIISKLNQIAYIRKNQNLEYGIIIGLHHW